MQTQLNSKSQIKKAGFHLIKSDSNSIEFKEAYDVLNSYRSLFPPLMKKVGNRAQSVIEKHLNYLKNSDFIISQRSKRLESIIKKLKRFETMHLNRIQDIAGVRVILPKLKDVDIFIKNFPGKRSSIEIKKINNYISKPKDDGYRSVHLELDVPCSKNSAYKDSNFANLTVELQVRTMIQHAWATAVEVVGLIQNKSFKTGEWDLEWLEFFKVSSELFALAEQQDLNSKDFAKKLKELKNLKHYSHFINSLSSTAFTIKNLNLNEVKNKNLTEIILDSNFKEKKVIAYYITKGYEDLRLILKEKELAYNQNGEGLILVLQVDEVKKLKQAYPLFFQDTRLFLNVLRSLEALLK
jgi:ppGpp synthetase/RelA/SpoT-type nucleotidyltranferase